MTNSKRSLTDDWYERGYARGRNGAPYNPPKHKNLLKHFNKGAADGRAKYENLDVLPK